MVKKCMKKRPTSLVIRQMHIKSVILLNLLNSHHNGQMKKTNKSKCPNLEQLELSLNAAGGINWEKKSFWKTVSVTAKHTHTLCCINSTPTEMHSR